MSSLVIFFTVVISVIVSRNEAKSISIQDVDVDKILDLVQQQRLNRYSETDNSMSTSSSENDSSDDDDSVTRTSKAEEDNIIDIIKQVVKTKNNKSGNRGRKLHNERSSNVIRAQIYDNGNSQRTDNIAYILGQLLNNRLNVEPKYQSRAKLPKKRLTPSRLLWNDNNKKADSLDDNSKIYIMLTPKAVQKTKSKSSINELVSKILSLSSSPANRNRQGPLKQKRYKGFAIRNNAGRRRGSREMYAPNDSVEDKPSKRGRNSNNGGGHTAIPYIRHRGENIYEKDN